MATLRSMFNAVLKRAKWSELFPPVACYEDRIFYLEDNDKRAYLGAVFYGYPLSGCNQEAVNRLQSVLSGDIPAGSYLQFGLLGHSDVLDPINDYEQRKKVALAKSTTLTQQQKEILWANTTARADMFRRGVAGKMMKKDNKRVRQQLLVISIKVPCPTSPKDKDFENAEEVFSRLHDGFNSVGMSLLRARCADYIAILREIIHPDQPFDPVINDNEFIRDQILEPGFTLEKTGKKHLNINGTWAKILSTKRLPEYANLSIMAHFLGDPSGLNNQIAGNYYASYTLFYPDQREIKSAKRRNFAILGQQADVFGRLEKRLLIKKAGFEPFIEELDRGGIVVQTQLSLCLYGRDKEEVDRAASTMSTYLSSYRLEMVEDSIILEALFTNNMPLFPSPESTFLMNRMRTLTIKQAINFCPILGEPKSNPKANTMLFNTPHGQVHGFDLYDSESNYNALAFAGSGSGKSFLTQQLVMDYLAEGARVWVIDIGRSYYKLSKLLGCEFIEFTENSGINLNPFTNVQDITEEVSMYETLLEIMAAPSGGLDDYRRVRLNESISQVYSANGPSMTVTTVAEHCQASEDKEIRDLGSMLHNFTAHGMFGHWFEGKNNLNFNSDLVVLELEELGGKPLLQRVVLMLLMAKIENEMYLSQGDGRKKIVIIDESWALFDDPRMVKFMIHGYRRFRKYDGAALLVLQNIMDFYRTPGMAPIAENSAHKIILKQEGETVKAIEKSNAIDMDEYGFMQMRGLHKINGWYSRLMLKNSYGHSLVDFKATEFAQVVFETKGPERHEVLRRIQNGEDPAAVINEFVSLRAMKEDTHSSLG